MKFCERVENYPISKLTSGFHAFATPSISSAKIAASSILKKAKGRKIFVQPTAIQRRRTKSAGGSRNKCSKGQKLKTNPFKPKGQSRKRSHGFASNVRENVPAPKKARRSMKSKTRITISKSKVSK